MKLMRRRHGATLAFVSVICLVIIVIGVGFFFLMKMMGGGRELAGSVDAGTTNVAKQALLLPSKKATAFSNPDVANNFELLGDNGSFNLANYNRLIAQSMIVALNAKEEGTVEAAKNAEKVWTAAVQVGQFLRQNHENPSVMGGYFMNLAGKSNIKMMGGNNISVKDYAISFMKRGGSTNVYVDPRLVATLGSSSSLLPINGFGQASPTGNKYLQGYTPLAVPLAGGINLQFSGIPVGPQDRPHLVNLGEFLLNGKDDFIAGKGSPAFPGDSLPPNSFKALGANPDTTARLMGGATACAIVGSLSKEFEMNMSNGYIEVTNGVAVPGNGNNLAATGNDIFSHSLAGRGIDVSYNKTWFCQGGNIELEGLKNFSTRDYFQSEMNNPNLKSNVEAFAMTDGVTQSVPDGVDTYGNPKSKTIPDPDAVDQTVRDITQHIPFIADKGMDDLIDLWCFINGLSKLTQDYLWSKDIPPKAESLKTIKKGNGDPIAEGDLRKINEYHRWSCHWQDYQGGMKNEPCLEMLGAFRRGYGEMGTTAGNDNGTGYTALEQFKSTVMAARVMCQNCAIVKPLDTSSGVKWFDHTKAYPAPKNPVNFGVPKTPYDYLVMIDSVKGADGCAKGSTVDLLLKRCQQIKPSIGRNELVAQLGSQPLPLGATMYLYVDGGNLMMSSTKPKSYISGTVADGKGASPPTVKCGKPYDVMYSLVDTSSGKGTKSKADIGLGDTDEGTDGSFPGWAFKSTPEAKCGDYATWIPSSGYNNLLGTLDFSNQCTGGGAFCQPN